MNEEQVYLAEVDLPVKASKFGIIFKDDSVITQEMYELDGKTIPVRKLGYIDSKYNYSDGTWSYKKEWLKNIRPKPNKVLKKVPLDKGTIELGDWIRAGNFRAIVNRINNRCYAVTRLVFQYNQVYELWDYSKDRGKTWLPMYKEVEVEE